MSKNSEIDSIDLKILALLSEDAKMPYTEIAKKVFVSGGTVHVRMRKLEEMGVVLGATLKIDYSKLGYDITAFLGIFLEKSSYFDRVAAELEQIPEVVSLHYTTGPYSMYCRIYCKDTNHLREVLHDKIQKIDGVERTESIISLEERVQRTIRLDQFLE
jgi:Lrp/AsnC family transcriptional regulator, regulator for asnA, asnC and gidA